MSAERGSRLRVIALVAAKNEADTIEQVVKELCELPQVSEVVVVADGSEDGTDVIARAAGARVLARGQSVGKGGAIDAALDRVGPADAYVLVDGDLGETASEAARLLSPVLEGRLDLAIGVLPRLEGGGFGLVKRAAATLIRATTGFSPREPLSGQRAATGIALQACRPLAHGFGLEAAMTIDAVRLGLRVGEVPVLMTHRATGRGASGFFHRARQGVHIMRAVVPRGLGIR